MNPMMIMGIISMLGSLYGSVKGGKDKGGGGGGGGGTVDLGGIRSLTPPAWQRPAPTAPVASPMARPTTSGIDELLAMLGGGQDYGQRAAMPPGANMREIINLLSGGRDAY